MGLGYVHRNQLTNQFTRSGKVYYLVGPEATRKFLDRTFAGPLHEHFLDLTHQALVGRQGEAILKAQQPGQALGFNLLRDLIRQGRGPGLGPGRIFEAKGLLEANLLHEL